MTTTAPDQTVININDNAPPINTDATNNEATNSSSSPTNTAHGDTTLNLETILAAIDVDNTPSDSQPTSTNISTTPVTADTSWNSPPILANTPAVDQPITGTSTPTITPAIDKTITSPVTSTDTPAFDKSITGTSRPVINPFIDKPITGPWSTTNTYPSDKRITGASTLTSTPSDDKPITFQATTLQTASNDTSNVQATSAETVGIEYTATAKPSEDALLLDELKKIGDTMKDKPTRDGVFAAAICAGLCGSSVILCCLGVAAIIPLLKLIIGWHYADQCPVSWRIPHYLVIAGTVGLSVIVLGIVQAVFGIISALKSDNAGKVNQLILRIISILITAANIFLIIWLILGCIWIFRVWNKVQYKYPDQPNFCHSTLYRFAYWLIFLALISHICTCSTTLRQLRGSKTNKNKGQAKFTATTEP